jgi:DNA (cytosine-5)-methyltransferase 1
MSIKYIDLCCGIGGFRVGINNLQREFPHVEFECVFSADIKDDAIKTYNLNFSESLTKTDIYMIEELPEFDLLCAGFPCQPFSSAGAKKGLDDKRGGMIFKIVELCKKYQPRYFMLENVSNLITLEKGTIIQRIVSMFNEIGYNVAYKKLNSCDFSVPQSRERVYIVGDLLQVPAMDVKHCANKVFLKDAIDNEALYTDIPESLCAKLLSLNQQRSIYGMRLQDKRGGDNNIHSWDIGYNGVIDNEEKRLMTAIMTERRKKHWAEKKQIKWMDGMPLTLSEIQTFFQSDNLQDMLADLVSKGYLKLEKCKDVVDGKRQYKDDSEEGYNICKGKLSFPISKVLDPSELCPTLTATDSCKLVVMIDNKHIRKLTDIELKRICGFPDDFRLPEGVNKYDLFGNMVTPPVITEVLKSVLCLQ